MAIIEIKAADLNVGDVYDTRCGVGDLAWATITHVEHFTLPGGGDRIGITYEGDAICNSRILVARSTVRIKAETPEADAPIIHAEELDEQGHSTGHALCGQDGPLANSSWQVTCEKCLTWHDEPSVTSASEFARTVCPPRDHQAALPRTRSGKPGTAIQRAIAAYRNRAVLTAAQYLASLGADSNTIRRYASAFGRKLAQAYRSATGSEPVRSGWAVAHHRLIPVYAYGRDQAALLATVARTYKPTAALVEVG